MEEYNSLFAISPIDGRYRNMVKDIENYFSEYAYIKYRVFIEVKWLIYLMDHNISGGAESKDKILEIYNRFDIEEAKKVKEIEAKTNHDVKAIEYYIRSKVEEMNLSDCSNYIHFACTSDDINNLAQAKMIMYFLSEVYYPKLNELIDIVSNKSEEYKDVPMLAHTHGQKATPTTIGKEFAVFAYRLNRIADKISKVALTGKFSGAVGNFNAHSISYPELDWIELNKNFVESLGIEFNYLTTQIESHDTLCELLSEMKLLNNVITDLDQDMWMYISYGYFTQKLVENEVGSSVMPHKVNPINFENSMANTSMANSVFDALINNLQISRMQRDLRDSSLLRNLGTGFGYTLISIIQTGKGLNKCVPNKNVLDEELENSPEVLAEAIQTILRKNGYDNAYEMLKELTRGKKVTLEELRAFVKTLDINEVDKSVLLELTPQKYIGYAARLCEYKNIKNR